MPSGNTALAIPCHSGNLTTPCSIRASALRLKPSLVRVSCPSGNAAPVLIVPYFQAIGPRHRRCLLEKPHPSASSRPHHLGSCTYFTATVKPIHPFRGGALVRPEGVPWFVISSRAVMSRDPPAKVCLTGWFTARPAARSTLDCLHRPLWAAVAGRTRGRSTAADQERGLLSHLLFGTRARWRKMLSESPRVHPRVQDPGCADITQQRRCVQLCPRIYSKRHFSRVAF